KAQTPLAERLVYRNRRRGLNIAIEPDAQQYSPRDTVTLTVTTTDDGGQPVPASLALSVVDDTVVSFADDKTGHLLSGLLLEQVLAGSLEDPNVYFDRTEPDAAQGLDLLMGTRGWRRFAWSPVFNPPPPRPKPELRREMKLPNRAGEVFDFDDDVIGGELVRPEGAMIAVEAAPPAVKVEMEKMEETEELPVAENRLRNKDIVLEDAPDMAPEPEPEPIAEPIVVGDIRQKPAAGKKLQRRPAPKPVRRGPPPQPIVAAVRVFPVPTYRKGLFDEPRTDFRDTVYWAPSVRTDSQGKATVQFPLSDAVTSFRVFAEGIGGGALGRQEEVLSSNLPFSMSVKLPLEVSAGDTVRLPLSLSNASDRAAEVTVEANFGPLLTFDGDRTLQVAVPPRSSASLFFPVVVSGDQGTSEVSFQASSGTLSDAFVREVRVVPPGFPQTFAASGDLQGRVDYDVDLNATIPGSIEATLNFYPSPVSTMVSGMEGMLRRPGGCFEQASSTNYPNLMVMRYLKEHNIEDPALWKRSGQLLDQGYALLTGYESPQKGYEWFGGDPGHEALTAYGLMEFVDMQGVWSGVDASMVKRTAAWLKSRRDGEGGFLRNARALDSFGRASKEVTDAYIVYALTEGGFTDDFQRELQAQAEAAQHARDPYLLALTANSLLNAAPDMHNQGRRIAQRLAQMQDPSGVWDGADHSITRSGGQNLQIETTALATMAL
ncbi:MAG: alpha-2-macroglobulin family protein, partial [Myxococcota bacterium]